MKNRQLMRLNKVSHNGIIKTIDCISPGFVSFMEDRKSDDDFGYWVNLDDVEFISLTEEILLKCGIKQVGEYFEVGKRYLYFDNSDLVWYLNADKGLYYCNNIDSVEYLHELQNVYYYSSKDDYMFKREELQINL